MEAFRYEKFLVIVYIKYTLAAVNISDTSCFIAFI